MNAHADKTQENTSPVGRQETQSVAGNISQIQSGGTSTVKFVDNRPEAVVQRKLREMANNGPQVSQLRTLQEMANNSPQNPIQRVVKRSTAPWGATKNKWITTLDTSVGYDTQEEAQAAEDIILEEQAQSEEDAWQAEANVQAWVFKDAAGRLTEHFNDGWGEAYGITSLDDIREYIENQVDQENESLGKKVIDLGNQLNYQEHLSRPCSIMYEVIEQISITVGPITRQIFKREVYHCGPADNN